MLKENVVGISQWKNSYVINIYKFHFHFHNLPCTMHIPQPGTWLDITDNADLCNKLIVA